MIQILILYWYEFMNSNYIIKIMSSSCVKCQNSIDKAVVLVCDHELCLSCAEEIKKPEGTPPLDAKFRIVCPRCHKNTLTHNVQNLINQENDKFLFENVESSQLNQSSLGQVLPNDPQKPKFTQRQLKQMSYSQRFSNIWADRKTPDVTERCSKASIDSKKQYKNSTSRAGNENNISTQCHIHKQNLMFYCEQQKRVMCMQCIYKHTKDYKNHKIFQIKEALLSIQNENKGFKQEAKKKIEEIQKCITICKGNKNKIEQAFQIHQQLIDKQFKELQTLIKNKRQETLEYLEKVFEKKQKDVNSEISDFNYLKNCLKEHYDYPLDSQQSQVYFFNAYSIMRDAVNKGSTKIKSFDKEELTCFDKLCSVNDFKILLQKFLKPKKDGRESKAVSRGGSESGTNPPQKPKNALYDEYKSAKKNLQKINKMEKQHKGSKEKNFHYLNNYVIDIQKKDGQNEKGAITIRERKSSMGAYTHHEEKKNVPNKALTPTRLMASKPKKK